MSELNEKIYQLTIENNTNIKHLMEEHKSIKEEIHDNTNRISAVENIGKKTIKEHLISFSKVCGGFLVIGGATQLIIKIGKTWL